MKALDHDAAEEERVLMLDAAAAPSQRSAADAASVRWWRRSPGAAAAAALATLLAISFFVLIALAARLQAASHKGTVPAECLHALGGGLVAKGGEFPHVTPPYCKQLLTQYSAPSSGAYWREVTAAAQSAIAALGLNPESGGGDDDDAELAAPPRQLPGSRRGAAGGGGGRSPAAAANSSSSSSSSSSGRGWRGASNPVFVFDIDETALSNLPDISLPHWPAARQLAAAPRSAPPLKPVLRLYRALHAAGISLAFVTGRGEEGRADTAANLRAAGYGGACDGSDGSRVRPPVPPGAAGQRGGAQQEEPCYVLLMLRPPGEDRLASVYKPWARKQLVDAGYELLGSIGDQFSDLAGEYSAPYSFKLPNVWYFIL